jgi:hypothetical protein
VSPHIYATRLEAGLIPNAFVERAWKFKELQVSLIIRRARRLHLKRKLLQRPCEAPVLSVWKPNLLAQSRCAYLRTTGTVTLDFMAAHTSRSAATSGRTRDTGSRSSGGGMRGTLLPYRTCSRSGRRSKSRDRPCGATSRIADIVCEGRTGRGFSPDQARGPKPRTIWRGNPGGHTCHGIMT